MTKIECSLGIWISLLYLMCCKLYLMYCKLYLKFDVMKFSAYYTFNYECKYKCRENVDNILLNWQTI